MAKKEFKKRAKDKPKAKPKKVTSLKAGRAVALRAKPGDKFQLALPGVITATSYDLPKTMDYPVWANSLAKVEQIRNASQWWLGDSINFGEGKFGEAFMQAVSDAGLSENSFTRYKYVASRVAPENRVPALSWSHHLQVAKLPAEEQVEWLQRALDNAWTVEELIEAMKSKGKRGGGTKVSVTKMCAVCNDREGVDCVCLDCEGAIQEVKETKLSKVQRSTLAWAFEYIVEPDGLDAAEKKAWSRKYKKLQKIAEAVGNES